MRVALNGTALLSPLTGIGQYTYHLAQGLRDMPGVELDIFYGSGWSKDIRSSAPPRVATLKTLVTRHIPNSYAVARFVRQYRFNAGMREQRSDVYHEPNFLAFKSRSPAVITVHDLSWIRYPESHPVDRVRSMNQFFEPALKRASLILTDSVFVKNELIDVFGMRPEMIVPVLLGVEPLFRPQTAEATHAVLEAHGLVHGQYVLAVGTLEPRKNLKTALEAFAMLPAEIRRRFPMIIVGMKGWHTSDLEKQLAPMVASGEVRLLGYVSREDLATIIAGALTLVYPSIYEGFGLPPLEAMACGVPVITSDIASLPEVVGDTGMLVHPHDREAIRDAILRMAEDPAFRQDLSQRSLARSAQFTWERCVAQTVDAYRSVITK